MKNVFKILSLTVALGALIFTTSCGKDDGGGIIIGGGEEGSFKVADGLYIAGVTATDTTIVNAAVLTSAVVEDEGFGTQERDGYSRAWVYLTAGNYFFAEVDEQEVVKAFGGVATVIDSINNNADLGPNEFKVVSTVENGASFEIDSDGVYFVSFDEMENESLLVPIDAWGVLGGSVYKSVCAGVGFSEDVDLPVVSSSADGTTWEATNVILRSGEVKFRMDNVWKIDAREGEPDNDTHGAEFGYVAQLNLGGSLDALTDGGANIAFTESGLYTITLSLSASGIFSATLVKTGEAEECTFDPANFPWGIIGSATQPDGWSTEKKFTYANGDGGVHKWRGVFPLAGGAADNAFKFRTNDTWATKLIPTNVTVTDNTEDGTITDDGATNGDGQWFVADGKSGLYYFEITTDDSGATWSLTIDEAEFQLIGEGSPVGNWNSGEGMTMTYNDDLASATATGNFTTGGWKIFVNQSFDYNLGGMLDGSTALVFNSDVATVPSAGNYTVTITTADGGVTYTATATVN